jgi:hypothetical protein
MEMTEMMEKIVSPVMKPLMRALSKVEALPGIKTLSDSQSRRFTAEEVAGYLRSQTLAQDCALEIGRLIQPGWSEKQAVKAMDIWLRDHGVKSFFHKPFAWWGSRSRFDGIKNYRAYQATDQRLLEGDIFILDVAPIVDGFISDIGMSAVLGDNPAFDQGLRFLTALRAEIPQLVTSLRHGASVWRAVDQKITAAGYENIHVKYPFGVLGHRVYRTESAGDVGILNFGWQSFWEITSRGIFGQLLNADFSGSMEGLWAIEPQIGGRDWGMKFEEILVVEDGQARWLNPEPRWYLRRSNDSNQVH